MQRTFTQKIAPYVNAELANSKHANSTGDSRLEFAYLERAHVLGQESTFLHVKVHLLMLAWALRNISAREVTGQIVRTLGALLVTPLGLVPLGNTGGANVSPFEKMAIDPELAALIKKAKTGK
ncbi:DUF3703 domain-containing protein [Pseudomonas anguilliseptica]|uniref:DUF3703 domain-containing protein n=1 Tax=Pseudomonas anguilliseptica TaxID=53406 RepID=UPI0022AE5862|nr:DUF3703 domain-containing protein [Pseudomonas anguilliseptica]MCZ4321263.1 DUF3703 domain-containing protein [Pseudomonas anguilliseptica]